MKPAFNIIKLIFFIEWIVIFILQLGYTFDTQVPFWSAVGLFVFVIALLCCCFLVINRVIVKLPQQESFLLLFMLIITLFAYPLKQLRIYYDSSAISTSILATRFTDLSSVAIGNYLTMEYAGYLMLLLGVWLCTLNKYSPPKVTIKSAWRGLYRSRYVSMSIVVFAFLLMIPLLFLMKKFGMFMGAGGVYLPFHMAGVILYSHLILVPMLILLAILVQPAKVSKLFIVVITSTILIYIVGDMTVRMSRGSLLVVMMLLIGLIVSTRPYLTKKFMYTGMAAILATILLFPIATTIRMAQVFDNWEPSFLQQQYESTSSIVVNVFIFRVTGAEYAGVTLSNMDFDKVNISEVLDQGVVTYFGNNVLHLTEGRSGFSPSGLGEALILFGEIGGLMVLALFPLFVVSIHRFIKRYFLFSYPLAYAFLFAFAIKAVTGGVFAKDIYTLAGACLIAKIIDFYFMRIRVVRPSKVNDSNHEYGLNHQ